MLEHGQALTSISHGAGAHGQRQPCRDFDPKALGESALAGNHGLKTYALVRCGEEQWKPFTALMRNT